MSIKAIYARFLANVRALSELAAIHLADLPESLQVPPGEIPKREGNPEVDPSDLKVCIVGAGVAGLYAARILDTIGIKYDLYEASERAGGRVLTHYFSEKPHDYYDIGEQSPPRLKYSELLTDCERSNEVPRHPCHEKVRVVGCFQLSLLLIAWSSTFRLFKELGVPLKPYYMSSESKSQPSRYNDITKMLSTKEEEKLLTHSVDFDPFHVSVKNEGPVPDE